MADDPTRSAFERVVQRIADTLVDREVDVAVGSAALTEYGGAKRVVFVPMNGRLSAPERQAYKHPSLPNLQIRPLYTNTLTLAAHITASDLGELDSLWLDVLSATRRALGVASQPGAYRYESEGNDVGVSAPSQYAALTQMFEWSLSLAAVADTKTDSTVYGERTVMILGVEIAAELTT